MVHSIREKPHGWQLKLSNPLTTRAITESFYDED